MNEQLDYSRLNQPRIGVGVIGYGFMGKVHSNAYLKIPYAYRDPAAYPQLIAMAGRDRTALVDTARRFGYRSVYTDWRELVRDPGVSIVDNCTPDDLHAEASIAALEAGKHVVCEGGVERYDATLRTAIGPRSSWRPSQSPRKRGKGSK